MSKNTSRSKKKRAEAPETAQEKPKKESKKVSKTAWMHSRLKKDKRLTNEHLAALGKYLEIQGLGDQEEPEKYEKAYLKY